MSLPLPGHALDRNDQSAAAERVTALEQENEQLRQALESRVVIEQAKGAVSGRFGILPDEAFELIRGLARSKRRSLREFAAEVVRNGGVLGEIVGGSGQPWPPAAPSAGRHPRAGRP
jgi:hypothetical protein